MTSIDVALQTVDGLGAHVDISPTNPLSVTDAGLSPLSLEATQAKRYGGGKTAYAAVLSASGDTTVITPPAGKSIKVSWVGFVPNSDNTAANLVTVQFGPTSGTHTPFYICYALAHWEPFTGAVNQPLVVNLANSQPVAVNIHYEEF